MIILSNISKAYGPKTLFSEVSLRFVRGEKLGLVGPNGAGKTTLFSIILGDQDSDQGKVEIEKGKKIGFLAQESAPTGDETVLELATSISPELAQIQKNLRLHPDPEDPIRIHALEEFAEHEGFTLEARAKKILAGLAFQENDYEKTAKTLSGGWIMRAHLARLLVMEPDLLMLDEPTNHLDLETLGWFQNQLKRYPGAILTISHDRAFLNGICDGILEIGHGKLHRYQGNYDRFLTQRAERKAQYLAAYRNQQREIAHHEDFIRRFRAKASKAAQAQARIKLLDKIERLPAPESDAETLSFRFPQPERSGHRVVTLNGVRQAYGDHLIYENLNLEVEKAERIVLVGPNGAGKSTLLKILADLVPIESGERELGHQVSVGYFSQQRVDLLNLENSVLDEAMQKVKAQVHQQEVRGILGTFLFKGDDVFKKVKVLSGGEKSRLALVKLLLSPPNLILLDEPTTHLDMPSIDAVIQALKNYTGTLIFVSHDLHFIRAIAKRTIRIEAGKTTNFAGDYDYYLWKSGSASAQGGLVEGLRDARPNELTSNPGKGKVISAKERRRTNAEAQKKASIERKRLEQKVEKIEKEILSFEEQQAEINLLLADPESYNDPVKGKTLNEQASRIARKLKERNYEWEIEAGILSKLLAKPTS
ncbi:MAG: ABC-F family ATP-binding cassette domain-containing protein [Opitutales bacterium]|jgi:ATP-binding cassette subfamily F protein 3|tara:strand:+ start:263 stop:2212 length:1950 start_codon:yes stop_codon:yes gene_type:complete